MNLFLDTDLTLISTTYNQESHMWQRYIYWIHAFVFCFTLTSCMLVPRLSEEELKMLDNPPATARIKFSKLFPRALDWFNKTEAQLLPQGRPLSATELETASKLKVVHPELVRIVALKEFPMPDDPELRIEAIRYGLGSYFEGGRTMGYAIMLKPQYADDPIVIAHELVHVSQHDRLGRDTFLQRYLLEMEIVRYARSPLELEAYEKQDQTR